jgi:hypothetical protein
MAAIVFAAPGGLLKLPQPQNGLMNENSLTRQMPSTTMLQSRPTTLAFSRIPPTDTSASPFNPR